MRQGPNNRRSRSRNNNNQMGSNGGNHGGNAGNTGNNRRPTGPNRHQNFDSNGPDVRIRGNAFQVYEKYQALARDAQTAGDRVAAENFLQHAEHYHRIIGQITEQESRQRGNEPRPAGHHGGYAPMNPPGFDDQNDQGDEQDQTDEDREPVTL